MNSASPAHAVAERLAKEFLSRVWGPSHDLDAIDELMTQDYVIISAGKLIRGRQAFKSWVAEFHRLMPEATNEVLDLFANPNGDRVAARWICSGRSNGVFGVPADGRRISFGGLSVWAVRDHRLSECWVERSTPEFRTDK